MLLLDDLAGWGAVLRKAAVEEPRRATGTSSGASEGLRMETTPMRSSAVGEPMGAVLTGSWKEGCLQDDGEPDR